MTKRTGEELARAIRAKCMDCSGGIRKEVTNCNIKNCPLWAYRLVENDGTMPSKTIVRGQLTLDIGL